MIIAIKLCLTLFLLLLILLVLLYFFYYCTTILLLKYIWFLMFLNSSNSAGGPWASLGPNGLLPTSARGKGTGSSWQRCAKLMRWLCHWRILQPWFPCDYELLRMSNASFKRSVWGPLRSPHLSSVSTPVVVFRKRSQATEAKGHGCSGAGWSRGQHRTSISCIGRATFSRLDHLFVTRPRWKDVLSTAKLEIPRRYMRHH